MNKTQTANKLRLAAELIETGHPFEFKTEDGWVRAITSTAEHAICQRHLIRPILVAPPDNRPLHNPDGLSAEQVGVGYRLVIKGETPTPGAQIWMGDDYANGAWEKRDVETDTYYACTTYRLPLSVPWPEAKPEPIPFQLPPPPPGMTWHREDGWNAEQLPQGYRPLVYNECRKNEDEWTYGDGNGWRLVANYGPEGDVGKGAARHRTTRPLIFAHEGIEWTWHRPGDPMPCDGERRVCILMGIGAQTTDRAKSFRWTQLGQGSDSDMIGWRYVETTKQGELGPEDVIAKLKEAIAMLQTLANTKA